MRNSRRKNEANNEANNGGLSGSTHAGSTSKLLVELSARRAASLRNQDSTVAKKVKMDAAEDLEESREGLQRDGRFYASKYAWHPTWLP